MKNTFNCQEKKTYFICIALGEDCFETGECVVTECSGANSVVCEIPSDGGSGKCTCAIAEGKCLNDRKCLLFIVFFMQCHNVFEK